MNFKNELQELINNYNFSAALNFGFKNICTALRGDLRSYKYSSSIKNQRVLKGALLEVKNILLKHPESVISHIDGLARNTSLLILYPNLIDLRNQLKTQLGNKG
jgi:hypothetical protein